MAVKIEIHTDGYPLPDQADCEEVISARIGELEEVLNALEVEKSKAVEKKNLLVGIIKQASRPRNAE